MNVKSYDKFIESNSDDYSIYDWYHDLRFKNIEYEDIRKQSDIFIGNGIFTKIERKIDDMFSIFEKIDINMIKDMLVELYDYVPQGKLKRTSFCMLHGDIERIDDPNTQSKFNGASCFIKLEDEKKLDFIKDILVDIIRPTLFVTIDRKDIMLRRNKEQYGSKYDIKYSCRYFNWNDYSVEIDGVEKSIHTLPSYVTNKLRIYDVKKFINMRQPGLYLSIDEGSYEFFNLQKTEDILDDIVPMIKEYLEDNGVQVEEFMFDNTRGRRQYDSNTDIMDYTLKVLLKQNISSFF